MRIRTFAPLLLTLGSTGCSMQMLEDALGSLYGTSGQPTEDAGQPSAIVQVLEQRNLVSNQVNVAAHRDPNLVNAWGLAFNASGPAWVSDNGTGHASVYGPTGNVLLTVTVPPLPGGQPPPAKPTGQVFNADGGVFSGDRFIIVTEDGTISGWQQGFDGTAKLRVDNSKAGATYKGVAIAHDHTDARLYAADFHNAKIDMFDGNYCAVAPCEGGFVDSDLPANYAPFNIFAANDLLFVSYALQDLPDKEDDAKGVGHGFIDVFDATGHLLERLASGGHLNSPWGMAIAPAAFGQIPNRLLVGNFGDGLINVFQLSLGGLRLRADFEGFIGDATGQALTIDGLWALGFPPDAGDFNSHNLYFTAGPNEENDGLFGRLELPASAHKAY
jgi:uncharacterized protein (TIGR03118 family)